MDRDGERGVGERRKMSTHSPAGQGQSAHRHLLTRVPKTTEKRVNDGRNPTQPRQRPVHNTEQRRGHRANSGGGMVPDARGPARAVPPAVVGDPRSSPGPRLGSQTAGRPSGRCFPCAGPVAPREGLGARIGAQAAGGPALRGAAPFGGFLHVAHTSCQSVSFRFQISDSGSVPLITLFLWHPPSGPKCPFLTACEQVLLGQPCVTWMLYTDKDREGDGHPYVDDTPMCTGHTVCHREKKQQNRGRRSHAHKATARLCQAAHPGHVSRST